MQMAAEVRLEATDIKNRKRYWYASVLAVAFTVAVISARKGGYEYALSMEEGASWGTVERSTIRGRTLTSSIREAGLWSTVSETLLTVQKLDLMAALESRPETKTAETAAEAAAVSGTKRERTTADTDANLDTGTAVAPDIPGTGEGNGDEQAGVPAQIQLTLYGNGGVPEVAEQTFALESFGLDALKEPKRLGKLFDGWYLDAQCQVPFPGLSGEETRVKLYAGWKEFPGYLCDDAGYVCGYTDVAIVLTNGLVALPTHESCIGIRKEAFQGIAEEIFEVYLPANITKIETDVFAFMSNLIYIQAAEGNPEFYSEQGVLYYADGSLAAMPPGRM